jgi:hypothetical protein
VASLASVAEVHCGVHQRDYRRAAQHHPRPEVQAVPPSLGGSTKTGLTLSTCNCGLGDSPENDTKRDRGDQAFKSAKSYLEYSSFSFSGLIGQLQYEGCDVSGHR